MTKADNVPAALSKARIAAQALVVLGALTLISLFFWQVSVWSEEYNTGQRLKHWGGIKHGDALNRATDVLSNLYGQQLAANIALRKESRVRIAGGRPEWKFSYRRDGQNLCVYVWGVKIGYDTVPRSVIVPDCK